MKILHLISSPRKGESISIKLANSIIEKLQAKHPESTVSVRDLTTEVFPHLDEVHLTSFFTPAESRSPELLEAVKHSDKAISELMDADIIVIGVPMYNFSIPSTLKSWIDHVVRAGATFKYAENGVEGLVKDKKVYLAIATGGVYSDGPMKAGDFTEPYIKNILGFIGLTDITAVRAEGIAITGLKEHALTKAIEQISL